MVQQHKQAAPPLSRLLLRRALAAAAAAAAAGAVWVTVQQQDITIQQQQQQQQLNWGWRRAAGMQNSSNRALGTCGTHCNSQGLLFVPRDGQQISLKYVLRREGVEIRVVQNQKHAVDAALANGLQDLLDQLGRRDAAAVEAVEDVVVVISDRACPPGRAAAGTGAGMATLAVCRKVKRYPGATATLRWQLVVTGRYSAAGAARPG